MPTISARNVRQTLLESLFLRPRAINPREYKRATAELFPGRESFINFLRAEDHQTMADLAKTIVTRLVYHHHLPPPTRLIFNLLDFEELTPFANDEGDFVPQDHFVHLIHLYLLGIYFFSHHRSIHIECTAEFNRLRRSSSKAVKGLPLHQGGARSNYVGFCEMWVMFVLYHDLAYPFELISPSKREERRPSLKAFRKITKSLLKDLSLKALAHAIVLSVLIESEGENSLGEMYLDHYDQVFFTKGAGPKRKLALTGQEKSTPAPEADLEVPSDEDTARELLSGWRAATFARSLGGPTTLRELGAVIPDRALSAVLENVSSGAPVALLRKERSGPFDVIWFEDPDSLPFEVRRQRKRLWELAFDEGVFPGDRFEWRYFAAESDTLLKNSIGSYLGEDQRRELRRILDVLESEPRFKEVRLVKRDAAEELGSITYQWLNLVLGYIRDDDEVEDLDLIFSSYKKSLSSIGSGFPAIIGRCVEDLYRSSAEASEIAPGDLLRTTERQAAVTELVGHLLSKARELAQLLNEAITPKIQEMVETEQLVRNCFGSIRQVLTLSLPNAEGGSTNPFDSLEIDSSLRRIDLMHAFGDVPDQFDASFERAGLGGFTDVFARYEPSWANRDGSAGKGVAFDHGLVATVVALTSARFYDRCLRQLSTFKASEAPASVGLLRMALGTTSSSDEEERRMELWHLISDVSVAIALHNLYPKYLPPEMQGYRTKLGRAPFAYLAILSDSLQKWDRRRLVRQAREGARGHIPGSQFDLRIEGDLIHVVLRGRRIDMKVEEEKLRGLFRQFLSGADELIRLNLMEF